MTSNSDGQTIWAALLHLGYNLWHDREVLERGDFYPTVVTYRPHLRFDRKVWNDVTGAYVDAGANMVVVDVADGVRYESHPEIGVRDAWSVSQLKEEVDRLRGIGLEPIPSSISPHPTTCGWRPGGRPSGSSEATTWRPLRASPGPAAGGRPTGRASAT